MSWGFQVVSEKSLEQISQMEQLLRLSFKMPKILVSQQFKD